MNCKICGHPLVLVPSAVERARKYGGVPSDYTKLFETHASCSLEKNKRDTVALMRRLNAGGLQ